MQPDDSFPQLLKVVQPVQALVDIVFEHLLKVVLRVNLDAQVGDLVGETFLPHAQVVYYQGQVLIHSVEMLQFSTHLVRLLVQLLDLDLAWTDVSLQLLDLIVEDELELL